MIIKDNHWLEGDNLIEVKCPKNQQLFTQNLPDTIIIHFTVGSTAKSSAEWLARDDVKASAHLVIGRDGKIFQLVPFNTVAWHAGESSYGNRTGFNKYSIGIELDNAGALTKTGNSYISSFGKVYPESEAVLAKHRNEEVERYWHTFTEIQIQTCTDICIALIAKYGIKTILGHEEICPGRKTDPGPAFPLDKLRNDLLKDTRQDSDPIPTHGQVAASLLNIRQNPSASAPLQANPLPQNASVTILDEKDGWYKVRTEIEGWVKKDFIKPIK